MARNGRAGVRSFNVKEWRERNRARIRKNQHKHQIKKLYGLTVEQYDAMLVEQRGRCAICGEPMKKPMVDHDHGTGAVRALLCNGCNLTLGWLENPVKRRLFDEYLARFR